MTSSQKYNSSVGSNYTNDNYFGKLIPTFKIESRNCHTAAWAGNFERGYIRAIRFENPKH